MPRDLPDFPCHSIRAPLSLLRGFDATAPQKNCSLLLHHVVKLLPRFVGALLHHLGSSSAACCFTVAVLNRGDQGCYHLGQGGGETVVEASSVDTGLKLFAVICENFPLI